MIEKRSARCGDGSHAQVLFTRGLENDLLKLASDDVQGRKW